MSGHSGVGTSRARSSRAAERSVNCHCFSACTLGFRAPVQRQARVRESHLAADRRQLQAALARGQEPPQALYEAIDLNETAIAIQDDPASDSTDWPSDSSAGDAIPSRPLSRASRRALSRAPSISPARSPAQDANYEQDDEEDFFHHDNDNNYSNINIDDNDFGAFEPPPPSRTPSPSHSSPQGTDDDIPPLLQPRLHIDGRDAGSEDSGDEEDEAEDDDEMVEIFDGLGFYDGEPEEEEQENDGGEPRADQEEEEEPPREDGPSSTHAQDRLDELVGRYRHGPRPANPPEDGHRQILLDDLPPSERASLRHFRTTVQRKLTDAAAVEVAADIEDAARSVAPDAQIKVMSKYKTGKYVSNATKLKTNDHPMCPNSCMAFVGENAHLEHCTAKRDGEICGAPKLDANRKPLKTFTTMDLLSRVRVKFAVGARDNYFCEHLTRASETLYQPGHVYRDFTDGELVWRMYEHKHMFQDEREEAYILSVDGIQMPGRKETSAWIVLLTCLSSSPEERYRRKSTFVHCIIPGPKNPVDMDSFLWPLMEEFARASKGFWVWDGVEQSWFLWRAYLVFATADQPGSQKINKMTGTTGFSGCRDCFMVANYSGARQVGGYYPVETTGKQDQPPLNVNRPDSYDPYELPLRTDDSYAAALAAWDDALTDAERAEVRREHGMSGAPLLAASPAFSIPWFFPSDVFHLYGVNLPSLIWTTLSNPEPGDPFGLSDEQKTSFADMLAESGNDLPASFSSGLPRDPTEFSGSHYKMFEWSLITYLYLLPFLFSIGAPVPVLRMMHHLEQGVRISSSDAGCTETQRQLVQQHFVAFSDLWELHYVRGQSALVHRATDFIRKHGSVKISSQARCEREAGLLKSDIRSRKKMFTHITNTLVLREHLRLLNMILDADQGATPPRVPPGSFRLTVRLRRQHRPLSRNQRNQMDRCIAALIAQGHLPDDLPPRIMRGRLELSDERVVRGSLTETTVARRSSRFMARSGDDLLYGEALLFITFAEGNVSDDEAEVITPSAFVLARPLEGIHAAAGIARGTHWGEDLFLLDAAAIVEPVGILHLGGFMYILRKLSWLEADE